MKAWNLKAEEFTLSNGTEISAIVLGEYGRGRMRTIVPAPMNLEYGDCVCLAKTRTGRQKIVRCDDCGGGWLMRVLTKGAYIRDAYGNVRAPKAALDRVKVVAKGYGAFGDAGRIGTWYDYVIHVSPKENEGIVLRVKPSRGEPWFLVVSQEEVQKFRDDELLTWIDVGAPENMDIVFPKLSGENWKDGWKIL